MMGSIEDVIQKLYYGHSCTDGCTHEIINLVDEGIIDDILNDFARALHNGELNGKRIHSGLYSETARKLTEAITKGVGKVSFGYDDPNNALKAKLLSNVHAFSGAKSLTENAVYSQLLLDEQGVLKPFKQFLNDVQKVNKLYNENYLNAEYNHAVANAQTAILWNQFNDDDWIEYSTAGDERVRNSHAAMDGITMLKTSPFWNTHWPPNGWNCRCTVVPGLKPAKPLTDGEAGKVAKGAIEGKEFEYNSGQSGIVFKDDHPYFKSHKGINKLDALKNYGLPEVEKILKRDNLPTKLQLNTETDYYAWWDAMVKAEGVNDTDFVLKDKLGTNILFDASPDGKKASTYFKDHLIRKTSEARHEYAANIKDIVTNADEVWNNADGWFYIKYYSDGMYVLIIEDANVLRAKTMYKVEEANYITLRKGILLN